MRFSKGISDALLLRIKDTGTIMEELQHVCGSVENNENLTGRR